MEAPGQTGAFLLCSVGLFLLTAAFIDATNGEAEAQRSEDSDGRFQGGVPLLAERSVKRLSGEAGIIGDPRHTFGAGRNSERMGKK